jgi:hypothetical protein
MDYLFHIAFVAGLAKTYYDIHRNDFIFKMLMSLLMPKGDKKTDGEGISIATRTASKTILIPYMFQGVKYEAVLPVRRKKLNWSKCIAEMNKNGELKDVTQLARERGGVYGDFYEVHKLGVKAHQIVRNADKLVFLAEDDTVVFVIE